MQKVKRSYRTFNINKNNTRSSVKGEKNIRMYKLIKWVGFAMAPPSKCKMQNRIRKHKSIQIMRKP